MSDDQPSADHPTFRSHAFTASHFNSRDSLSRVVMNDSACMQGSKKSRVTNTTNATKRHQTHGETGTATTFATHNAPSFLTFLPAFSSVKLFLILPRSFLCAPVKSKKFSIRFAISTGAHLLCHNFSPTLVSKLLFNSIQSIVATIAKDYHQTPSSTFFITSLVSSSPSVGRKITRRNKKLSPTAQVKINI